MFSRPFTFALQSSIGPGRLLATHACVILRSRNCADERCISVRSKNDSSLQRRRRRRRRRCLCSAIFLPVRLRNSSKIHDGECKTCTIARSQKRNIESTRSVSSVTNRRIHGWMLGILDIGSLFFESSADTLGPVMVAYAKHIKLPCPWSPIKGNHHRRWTSAAAVEFPIPCNKKRCVDEDGHNEHFGLGGHNFRPLSHFGVHLGSAVSVSNLRRSSFPSFFGYARIQ